MIPLRKKYSKKKIQHFGKFLSMKKILKIHLLFLFSTKTCYVYQMSQSYDKELCYNISDF